MTYSRPPLPTCATLDDGIRSSRGGHRAHAPHLHMPAPRGRIGCVHTRHPAASTELARRFRPHQLVSWSSLREDGSRGVPRLLLRGLGSTSSPLIPPSFAGHLQALLVLAHCVRCVRLARCPTPPPAGARVDCVSPHPSVVCWTPARALRVGVVGCREEVMSVVFPFEEPPILPPMISVAPSRPHASVKQK